MKWSFNRLRDFSDIEKRLIEWKGPFSWPKCELENSLPLMPDISGVYLFTVKFKDGYLIYGVGITNSTKRRISTHTREYKKGNYTVFDICSAENGERKEIWHGWKYAKTNQSEFLENKKEIEHAIQNQLCSTRIFLAEINIKRERERMEASIMHNLYVSKEPWSELADRGMFLKERYNSEMPIEAKNYSPYKIYGLPETLEF